jgi:hypothetical protein
MSLNEHAKTDGMDPDWKVGTPVQKYCYNCRYKQDRIVDNNIIYCSLNSELRDKTYSCSDHRYPAVEKFRLLLKTGKLQEAEHMVFAPYGELCPNCGFDTISNRAHGMICGSCDWEP